MAGIIKEMWLNVLRAELRRLAPWLKDFHNLDQYVYNGVLHVPVRDPANSVATRKNGTIQQSAIYRPHTSIPIPMDFYDTQPEYIPDAIKKQVSYEMLQEHLIDHVNALLDESTMEAAYEVGPDSNTPITPVIGTSGPVNTSGVKDFRMKDIRSVAKVLNRNKIPMEGRIGVLTDDHMEQLSDENEPLYNQILNFKKDPSGEPVSYYGFTLYAYSDLVHYNATSGQKLPIGAQPSATDIPASLFWCSRSVGRGKTPATPIIDTSNPEVSGCMFNVYQFFKTAKLELQGGGTAAIYSSQ